MTIPDHPWSIPVAVANVPEGGLHFDVAADAATRAAIAKLAGVDAISRLEAVFDVARFGKGGLHVTGTVAATVGQSCVVTLEPLVNQIRESVDMFFAPPGAGAAQVSAGALADAAEIVIYPDEADPPEPLTDGRADLGRVATEFLLLAIDPYPRKPGVAFDAPPAPPAPAAEGGADSPFAALAALKKDRNEGG